MGNRTENVGEPVKTNRDWDSPELAALTDEQDELFNQMMNTKATTFEGLLSQITLLWEQCGPTRIGVDPVEENDLELRLKSKILQVAESLALASSWKPIDTKMTPASEF